MPATITPEAWSYALALGAVSFLITLAGGRPFISFLRQRGIEKQVRADGPASHAAKTGTPTMGGILIFSSVFAITTPFNIIGRYSILLPLGTIVACGILGAADDVLTLTGGERGGLAARFKLAWLLAIGIGAALVLHFILGLRSIYIPTLGKFDIGLWYLPIAILIIVGFANAINLTDGLDTLAGGTAALAYASYGIIAYLQGQAFLVTFCFTVAGATLGFLWYNAHPAQIFMGDTGSLALGATLGVVALMTGQWLLLPLIGLVFVVEAGSVILQVAYFRISGGRRIFRMSPLHHHFELSGWAETQITMRFWLLGMLAAMLGIALSLL